MSVGKDSFTPPNSYFHNKQLEGSRPSNSPALSTLNNQNSRVQEINLPDLLACVRTWHQGKRITNKDGNKLTIAWFCLEVIHLDTSTCIYTHDCDASEDDNEVYSIIKNKIEQRARGMGDGGLNRFEVRCHFRSEDGEDTAWEPFTVPIQLPQNVAQYGQPHYGGMGNSGNGGFGGFGGGGNIGNPANQHAVFIRANIDAAHRSDIVLMRAIDMIENHTRRLEASNARHEERADGMFRLMEDMYDRSAQRKRDDQMQELKMAALQAAVEKVLYALPLGLGIFKQWVNHKVAEKNGKVTSREVKSLTILKNLFNNLQKGPAGNNPEIIKGMLAQAGVTEETIDDAFSLFQEFAIDSMIEKAEKETKDNMLGTGGEENKGLNRLLVAAGVKKPDNEIVIEEEKK